MKGCPIVPELRRLGLFASGTLTCVRTKRDASTSAGYACLPALVCRPYRAYVLRYFRYEGLKPLAIYVALSELAQLLQPVICPVCYQFLSGMELRLPVNIEVVMR